MAIRTENRPVYIVEKDGREFSSMEEALKHENKLYLMGVLDDAEVYWRDTSLSEVADAILSKFTVEFRPNPVLKEKEDA